MNAPPKAPKWFRFFRNASLLACVLGLFFSGIFLPSSAWGRLGKAKDRSLTSLEKKLDRILRDSALRKAEVAVLVKSLQQNKVIYKKNEKKALNPASNTQLITTLAALRTLGPSYQFKTYFYTDKRPTPGHIHHLFVKGGGDPRLVIERLWRIAGDLRMRGIKSVDGDIVIDGSFFDQKIYANGWPAHPGDEAYYAPTAAFAVNFNTVAVHIRPNTKAGNPPQVAMDPDIGYLRVLNQAQTTLHSERKKVLVERLTGGGGDYIRVSGKLPLNAQPMIRYRNITNPLQYAGEMLKFVLENRGIEVKGQIRTALVPKNVEEVFVEKSPALSVLIEDVNKLSNNFMAEQLVKTMGAEIYGPPGTTDKGVDIMEKLLFSLDIRSSEFELENGSGLSRKNRISPRTFVEVLREAWVDPQLRPEFLSSLALGGLDGTLEERLDQTRSDIISQVRAKTGSLNDVSCISGYLYQPDGDILAFSILMNNVKDQLTAAQNIQDRFLNTLAQSQN